MILCSGEALIDMIPATAADGSACFVPCPGGGGLNTAIALGRLGVPCGMATGLSSDLFGQQLLQALQASNVSTAPCAISPRPTTLAFVTLEQGDARYAFYDENTAGRMLVPQDLADPGAEVTALFLGGISLACEPAAEAYEALLQRARGNRLVMLDPNIRPVFITDEPRYRARLQRILALSDVVKLSDEDLDWLQPGGGGLRDKLAGIQAKGPAVVLLTRGDKGASALLPCGSYLRVPAAPAAVADTVGAGDTFNAGFLAALWYSRLLARPQIRALSPEAAEAALKFAASAAAVTVSRTGANPPWRSELPG